MNEVELETLVGKLEGDGSSYQHMLEQAQHSVDEAADHVDRASHRIEGFGKTMRGFTEKAIAAVEVFGAGHWFKEAFEQFEEAESVAIRLHAVLEVNGRDVNKLTKEYTDYAEKLQETTTLEDDHILKLFQVAEGFNATGEAAKKAVRDAIALAAYTGQSEQAMLRLTTAAASGDLKTAQRFARMVKELRGVKDGAEFARRYQHLVDAGLKVSGELAETAGGRIKQLKVAWGNLLEVLGGAVSSVLTPVLRLLKDFTTWFGTLDKTTQVILLALPALIAMLGLLPFIFGAIEAVAAPFLAIMLNPWFLALAAGVAFVVYRLGGMAKTWELVKKAALDAWEWIQNRIAQFVLWVYPIWQAVDSFFSTGWRYVKTYARQAWEYVTGLWDQFTDWIGGIWQEVSDSTDVTWGDIQDIIQTTFIAAEFALDHFSEIAQAAATLLAFAFVSAGNDIKYLFTTEIPAYLDWFGDHWSEVLEGVIKLTGEVFGNLTQNIVAVFNNLPELIAGTVNFSDVWKPLETSLEKTLKTLPNVPKRPMTELEKQLLNDFINQAGALDDAFNTFRRNKLDEFTKDRQRGEVEREAEKEGEEFGNALFGGADKAAQKFDAALSRSLEAIARFNEYKEKLGGKTGLEGGAENKPIKIEAAAAAKGQEANARMKDQTDLLKQIRDGITKIGNNPPVVLENADL